MDNIQDILNNFLKQAKTNNLQTRDYPRNYSDLRLKVSFGQGNPANIPWISFLGGEQQTSKGIYPVYLYYKSIEQLVLAYGISETNTPEILWNLSENKQTIQEYFSNNLKTKPERYGESYVYSVYDTSKELDWQQIKKDLSQILKEYKEILRTKNSNHQRHNNTDNIEKLDIEKIKADIKSSGFQVNDQLITRFVCALLTKPFVILTGLSGSGKTKLAQIFARYVSESEKQYKMIPVGADWTNREPLLGFPNALEPGKYVWPENGALNLLLEAKNDPNKPYFLILDEMNLSHVERYFADFLSAMESNETISIHPDTEEWNNKNGERKEGLEPFIELPNNLFIIGTVNVDETTYMFSPKVLDRAQVLEFRVTKDDMNQYLNDPSELNITSIDNNGTSMAKSFLNYAQNPLQTENKEEIKDTLLSFFTELKKTDAEFGYRSAYEIYRYLAISNELDPERGLTSKIDSAIMQKLLPRVHGSRRKLEPVLKTLGQLCLQDEVNIEETLNLQEEFDFTDTNRVKYPMALEKIMRMYKDLIYNGFTSYAEA